MPTPVVGRAVGVALHAGGAPGGNVSRCITATLTSLDDGDTVMATPEPSTINFV